MIRGIGKAVGSIAFGGLACWLIINVSQPPGVVITSEVEAEGPQFSDANTLDLVLHVKRNRTCPSHTQRWVWRWTVLNGKKARQVIPIASNAAPFLSDDGEDVPLILTLPAAGIPDPVDGQWFFRSVTAEQCGFLPSWASSVFGSRLFRSPDVPVNFVGAPHDWHDAAKP